MTVIPTISTAVVGPLGVMHLPRFWLKNVLHALGRLPAGYKHTTGLFDRMLIEALGLDEAAVVAYVATALPDYLQFEAWVQAHARHLTPDVRDALNQRYRETLMSDGAARTRRAELGITDATLRRGIILNDLDDWSLLHAQLVAPTSEASLLDHVDLRVRDRVAATAFYDAFLSVLGAVKQVGAEFTTWKIPPPNGSFDDAPDNFGIVEDREHVPGAVRIAFKAPTRSAVDAVATILRSLGVSDVEMDDGIYGPAYYGVFFEDADGNRLEVCVNGPSA